MGKAGTWARSAVGVLVLAMAVTACGDDSNEARSTTQKQDGARTQPKTTPQPKADTPSGIALLLQTPEQPVASQIAFYDPESGTPTDILRLPPLEDEVERFVLAPDGRLAALEGGLSRVLHFFEPDLDAGQYVSTGSVEAEGSYSHGAPLLADMVLGPDDQTLFVEAYADARSVVFSTPLGGDSLTEEAKLPRGPDGSADNQIWPQGWTPWRPLPDGTIGAMAKENRRNVHDGGWTYQTWTADNGDVFAAAALEPDQTGGSQDLSGYFSIAQTDENRFIGRYDTQLAYGTSDKLLASLEVDPESGDVEVTPLLGSPSGGESDQTVTVLDPDRKRAAVYFGSGSAGTLYVADLTDPSSEPRELDLAEAPTIDVLGWI